MWERKELRECLKNIKIKKSQQVINGESGIITTRFYGSEYEQNDLNRSWHYILLVVQNYSIELIRLMKYANAYHAA
jgi:hypothetical protein